MTYQEKKILATMVSGTIIFLFYIKNAFDAYTQYGTAILLDGTFWARTMLIYVGISIIFIIVFMIILHVFLAISIEVGNQVKKQTDTPINTTKDYFETEDEMDRLINLKSGQIGYITVGIGFIAGLITLTLSLPIGIMLNILYLSFIGGNLLEGAFKIYFYRRGVYNG